MVSFKRASHTDIPSYARGRPNETTEKLISEFWASGMELVELEDIDTDPKALKNLTQTIRHFVERQKIPIKVIQRKEKVFLERVDKTQRAEDQTTIVGDPERIKESVIDEHIAPEE